MEDLAFHRKALRHPQFMAGEFDTGFIGREHSALTPGASGEELDAALIAAALDAAGHSAPVLAAPTADGGGGVSAWRVGRVGWRG